MKVCHVHQDFVALRSTTEARRAQRFRSVFSLCSSQCYLLEAHTLSKIVCASAASPLLPEPGSSREQSENSLTVPHLRSSASSAVKVLLQCYLLEPHTLS